MGLDIRAVSKLTKCEIQNDEAYEKYSNVINVTPEYDLVFNQSSGLNGYYEYSNSDYKSFRAGSYSGYGKWRETLAKSIGIDIEDLWMSVERDTRLGLVLNDRASINIPFVELLHFSDCEGCIGPDVSKKLHNDFVNNRGIVESYIKSNLTYPSDWMSLYDDFTEAFRIASNNGVVQFC